MFGIAAFRILPSLNRIIQSVNSIRASYVVIDLLEQNIKLKKYLQDTPIRDKDIDEQSINEIELKNVCFRYEKNQKNVLNNINLKLKKGDLIGLFGPSGSGKTTLVDIITNLIEPTEGEILINKSDINIKNRFKSSIGYATIYLYFK